MAHPNWKNRTLFHGDNLDFMRAMNSDCIDLIATDPPFNSGKDYIAKKGSKAEGQKFEDIWSWTDAKEEWLQDIAKFHPKLYTAILSAKVHSGAMGGFCCWLSVRLLEMHRVLKPTGSLYIHCDQTANSYIRVCLDAIFGARNFRNEIVWERSSSKNDAMHQYGKVTDSIYFYVKSPSAKFHRQFIQDDEAMENAHKRYTLDDGDGKGRYMTAPLEGHGVGRQCFDFHGVKPGPGGWNNSREYMEQLLEDGRLRFPTKPGGRLRKKVFLSDFKGKPVSNLWTDIRALLNKSRERTSWATQKPIALYERIIRASSNEGDFVLDPFAGCATTCVAAERAGRRWIGCDKDPKAAGITMDRLKKHCDGFDFDLGEMCEVFYIDSVENNPRDDDGHTSCTPLPFELKPMKRKRLMTDKQIKEQLIKEQNGHPQCQGCFWTPHHEDHLQVDHDIPKSMGGSDEIKNRNLLCGPCNRIKSNTMTLLDLRDHNRQEGKMFHQLKKPNP